MRNVACAFGGAELVEQRADAFPDGLGGALVGFPQQCLEFGEGLLDRIEVRAVWRQQESMGAGISDDATDGLAPIRVAGSVVCASVPITAEREGGTDLPGCLAA